MTVSTPPAVSFVAPVTTKWVATPAETSMSDSVPVNSKTWVSVAMIDWMPAVSRVTPKPPVPSVSMVLGGRMAWPSLLVILTVPV